MPKSWKPLLPALSEALDAGWKLAEISVERDSRVKIAGRDFEMSRSIGRLAGDLCASVSFYPEDRLDPRLHGRIHLPSGPEADALNRVCDQMAKLGYRGGWSTHEELGIHGHFSKDVRDAEGLKRELRVLQGLQIGEAKPRAK